MKTRGKILVKIRKNKQENIQEPIEKSQYRQEVLKKIAYGKRYSSETYNLKKKESLILM